MFTFDTNVTNWGVHLLAYKMILYDIYRILRTFRQFVFLCFLLLLSVVLKSVSTRGTTPHLKEIVLGRCFSYQETYKSKLIDLER